ncbi:MAG: hypothetical protein PHF72_07975 [Gammaproteobacteria bacterium]|nr:hypothetical protein [Gammaproteobacteria bacterium]
MMSARRLDGRFGPFFGRGPFGLPFWILAVALAILVKKALAAGGGR